MDRTISAAGKLFVAGEYAVLWGGTARILAVGPRIQVAVRPRADRQVDLVMAQGRLSGDATPLGVRWTEPVTEPFHFAATTVDLALRAAGQEGPGFSIAFEPSPLHQGHKLGLGSSARATALAAEAARFALGASFDALKLALVSHADAQRGKGSGGDVAAVFAGGLIRYRRFDTQALLDGSIRGRLASALRESPAVELGRVSAPHFPMLYVFSGKSASTTSLVAAIEQRLMGEARQKFVEQSDLRADALELAIRGRNFESVVEASAALQRLLNSLSPTRSEDLERLLALGRSYGCAGKQSGAGAGDGAIVFAPDTEAQAALLEAYRSRGFLAFALEVQPGLQSEIERAVQLYRWLDALA